MGVVQVNTSFIPTPRSSGNARRTSAQTRFVHKAYAVALAVNQLLARNLNQLVTVVLDGTDDIRFIMYGHRTMKTFAKYLAGEITANKDMMYYSTIVSTPSEARRLIGVHQTHHSKSITEQLVNYSPHAKQGKSKTSSKTTKAARGKSA